MKLNLIILLVTLITLPSTVGAGNDLQLLRQGNRLFEEGSYLEAEAKYREALELDETNYRAWHNLGNALYHQGRLEEAADIYNRLLGKAPSDQARAAGWHNLGNSLLGNGQVAESIEAYKQALRLRPDDEDTRYNLAYALNLLEEMPPDASSDGADESDGDDDGDQQQQDQQQAEGDDDKEQDAKGDQDRKEQNEEDQMAERPEQISLQDAERILDALRQQEQKVQEDINRESETTQPARPRRQW